VAAEGDETSKLCSIRFIELLARWSCTHHFGARDSKYPKLQAAQLQDTSPRCLSGAF
jgi:hypothetical protein